MLRRLGVRGKILATLAMPILVLALAAGWVSWDSLRTARTADQTAELVASLAVQDAAGSAVAAERSLNIAASMGIPGAKESLEAAIEETGKALAARDDALAAVDTDALDVRVRRAISATRADPKQIGRLQEQILDGTIPEAEATRQYNEYIENALTVAHELSGTTEDSTLSLHLDAYAAMDETMLAVVYERPVVGGVLAGAMAGQVDQGSVLRTVTTIDATNRQFEATKAKLDRLPGGHRLPPLDGALGTVRTALGQMDVAALDPAAAGQWNQLTQDWVTASQPVRDSVRDETAAYAQWLADEARTSAITTAGAAFGILALSILIALAVARRIVRPLRRLTAATGEIRDRLPQMVEQMAVPGQASTVDLFEIPVESRDEIGRLAQSFNDVNATTVAVAREQAALRGSIAEMFVNVARRDQVLLNRQLAFLDELERTEEDPSALASLFRLDHLATRMRRNAESLLVLAGIDAGRKVRAPMPLSDVIRTASSEIELYDRVHLDLPVDPLMLGHHALGAAHLLAELLENATMFSEPHTPVEVATAAAEGYVVVTVRDHGLGMTPAEVAEANRRVASRTAQDAVGAQRLGLYVVGRIAERLGATVSFAVGSGAGGYAGTGTLVTVAFPAALFLPDDAVALPEPTDPLEIAAPTPVAAPFAAPFASTIDTAAPAVGGTEQFGGTEHFSDTARVGGASRLGDTVRLGDTARNDAPEPSFAPVDLDALTDGTTSAGMPRRRTSTPEPVALDVARAEPRFTAPVEPGRSEHPEFDDMVLPPLEAPELSAELAEGLAGAAAWAPPDAVTAGVALPSRPRADAPALPEPEPVSTPTMAVQERSSFFTSFRALSELEETVTGTIHLDAAIEDPAAVPSPPDLSAVLRPEARPEPVLRPEARPETVSAGVGAPSTTVANSAKPSSSLENTASNSVHGRSVLPLRSSVDVLADPLDPYAIPDTLEARSEWMASAVLYEEMSALLRRGVFAEQAAALSAHGSGEAYRPVAAGADTPALLRRGASRQGGAGDSTVNPATDRFTARIDRDPEELRTRFSAYQSAIAAGRSQDEDRPST